MTVVTLEWIDEGIALIRMQDINNKNMFSMDLINGLMESFLQVKQMPKCKVIILTGFDHYFASGATQETLLELNTTKTTFNAIHLYRLALDADIPVIAAMQGHGIGGGFVMGMFADIILLGRESLYTTNFMKYGFTPGMGATFVIPKKLGFALGNEMLLTARNYRGEELKQRGVPLQVVERDKVLPEALKIAKDMNRMPRKALELLKKSLNSEIFEQLDDKIQQELNMHAQTIHQEEVRTRVLNYFNKPNQGL